MFPERFDELRKNYSDHELTGELVFESDFSENTSIFQSDVLITDWSNIAYEFSYCTLKPSVFINTPMKVMNPNYLLYGLEVLDITLRDKLGISVDVENINELGKTVTKLIDESSTYKNQIEHTVKQYLFYPGRSGEAGGKYIIGKLTDK